MNDGGRAISFNKVAIRDPAFNNIVGATLLLPEGWTLEGGFVYLPFFSIQSNLLYRATDPATGAAAETMPLQSYVHAPAAASLVPYRQNYMGSIHLPPPPNPFEFVRSEWTQGPLQHLRNARLVRVDEMPGLAAETARSLGGGRSAYAHRLRFVYDNGAGAWEEDVHLTLAFNPPGAVMLWYAFGHALRAPLGALDEAAPLLSVPITSQRRTLEWSAALEFVQGLFQQGRRLDLQNGINFQQMWMQYSHEAQRTHQQVYEERQASLDRQNFARREIIGGVETYVNPFDSRPVELPAGFSHYWVSSDDKIIASNEELFDPRSDTRREWRHLDDRYSPR